MNNPWPVRKLMQKKILDSMNLLIERINIVIKYSRNNAYRIERNGVMCNIASNNFEDVEMNDLEVSRRAAMKSIHEAIVAVNAETVKIAKTPMWHAFAVTAMIYGVAFLVVKLV